MNASSMAASGLKIPRLKAPRLEIDLSKIESNVKNITRRLKGRGISVTGITKSTLGSIDIARAFLNAGITGLGDSRIENIENMHNFQIDASMMLIRSPMLSQVDRVVAETDFSCNTELEVIIALSRASVKSGKVHGIILMIELGDLREGILPEDLEEIVKKTLELPGLILKGIGTNLACRFGVSPDDKNMRRLSCLADLIESKFKIKLDLVSGGNSANLDWAFGMGPLGRINNLRLGESLLLGCETLNRQPIIGLFTDAIILVAEVIESKTKPSQPWGTTAQNAFGELPVVKDYGDITQSILAIGRQDIDPLGLIAPLGTTIMDSSSDHLMVRSDAPHLVGDELSFQINYSTLNRAMTSPFVAKVMV